MYRDVSMMFSTCFRERMQSNTTAVLVVRPSLAGKGSRIHAILVLSLYPRVTSGSVSRDQKGRAVQEGRKSIKKNALSTLCLCHRRNTPRALSNVNVISVLAHRGQTYARMCAIVFVVERAKLPTTNSKSRSLLWCEASMTGIDGRAAGHSMPKTAVTPDRRSTKATEVKTGAKTGVSRTVHCTLSSPPDVIYEN